MQPRLNAKELSPSGMKALGALHAFIHGCGLEFALLELVKMRASQLNGCAHCLDMHSKELLASGESTERLMLLSAWREAPHYSPRERAALEWTEAVTLVADGHVSDEAYETVRAHFTETELVNLTLAIVAINGANRVNIAFRTVPGNYVAKRTVKTDR